MEDLVELPDGYGVGNLMIYYHQQYECWRARIFSPLHGGSFAARYRYADIPDDMIEAESYLQGARQ